jgi:hypothetical protein
VKVVAAVSMSPGTDYLPFLIREEPARSRERGALPVVGEIVTRHTHPERVEMTMQYA